MGKVQEKLARKAAAKEDVGLEEPEVATEQLEVAPAPEPTPAIDLTQEDDGPKPTE